MIAYLSGIIKNVTENTVIIEVNGVGYKVLLAKIIHSNLSKIGEKVNLYIYSTINVREGNFILYGFENIEELRFFELLITISGIGPKHAQRILSAVDLQTLQLAIIKEDDQYLKKVSGIGEKTAKRIVLELKNKVMTADIGISKDRDLGAESEAMDALVALGYSNSQAKDTLRELPKSVKSLEDRVKEALKILGGRK